MVYTRPERLQAVSTVPIDLVAVLFSVAWCLDVWLVIRECFDVLLSAISACRHLLNQVSAGRVGHGAGGPKMEPMVSISIKRDGKVVVDISLDGNGEQLHGHVAPLSATTTSSATISPTTAAAKLEPVDENKVISVAEAQFSPFIH